VLDGTGIIKVVERKLPLVACSLAAEDQRARLDAWASLLASAVSRAEVPEGMCYVFRPGSVFTERVRDLAAAEAECCTFLDFETVEQNNELRLTVTSHPEGLAALRFIFA
jgi:MerR family copper efflux transcriptional regulator